MPFRYLKFSLSLCSYTAKATMHYTGSLLHSDTTGKKKALILSIFAVIIVLGSDSSGWPLSHY